MISKYSHKGLNWIDLKSPSKDEIAHIVDQLSIPKDIEDKIEGNKDEDIVEINDDLIFVSIRNGLSFVVSDNFILSIHSKPMQAFDNFSKEMELDIIIEEQSKIKNNKLLFAYLLKNIYLDVELKSITNGARIKSLERQIIEKNKKLKLLRLLSIILLVATIIFICL